LLLLLLSGLTDDSSSNLENKKLESHAISTEWFKSNKSKSVTRVDSNVILDQPPQADQQPLDSLPPDLRGSKLRMSSFIGSSSTRTISIPKDLEDIDLDEKANVASNVCGQCSIL
jgi:hypothetical protein